MAELHVGRVLVERVEKRHVTHRTRHTQVIRRHDWLRSTVSYQQALTRGRVVIHYRLHEFERKLLCCI
mgnify:CR=1 FL=1